MTVEEATSDDPALIAALEGRVGALVRRFRTIAEGMRDLPLYNPAIVVEAVDFRLHDGQGLGVLITPWFMNLVLLPLEPQPFAMAAMGRKRLVELPAGQREFLTGGDEAVGLYEAHSLSSPLLDFASHDAAVAAARALLEGLMTPPPDEDEDTTAARRADTRSGGTSRRALLFGRG